MTFVNYLFRTKDNIVRYRARYVRRHQLTNSHQPAGRRSKVLTRQPVLGVGTHLLSKNCVFGGRFLWFRILFLLLTSCPFRNFFRRIRRFQDSIPLGLILVVSNYCLQQEGDLRAICVRLYGLLLHFRCFAFPLMATRATLLVADWLMNPLRTVNQECVLGASIRLRVRLFLVKGNLRRLRYLFLQRNPQERRFWKPRVPRQRNTRFKRDAIYDRFCRASKVPMALIGISQGQKTTVANPSTRRNLQGVSISWNRMVMSLPRRTSIHMFRTTTSIILSNGIASHRNRINRRRRQGVPLISFLRAIRWDLSGVVLPLFA